MQNKLYRICMHPRNEWYKLHKKSTSGFFKVFWVEGLGSRLLRPWLEKSWRVEGSQGLELKKVEGFKAFKVLPWKKLKANFKALSWSNPRFKAIVPRNLNFKVKIANSSHNLQILEKFIFLEDLQMIVKPCLAKSNRIEFGCMC